MPEVWCGSPGTFGVRAVTSGFIPSHPPGDGPYPAALRVDVSFPDTDTVVVTPVGDADLFTIAGLRQALIEATGDGRSRLIVDLNQLTFMDATTLGTLVQAHERISARGGTLQLKCSTRHGLRLLSITGLDNMLEPPL